MMTRELQEFKEKFYHKLEEYIRLYEEWRDKTKAFIERYWFRAVVGIIAIWIIMVKDVSFSINLSDGEVASESNWEGSYNDNDVQPMNTSLVTKKGKAQKAAIKDDNLANTFSNLNFDKKSSKKTAKRKKQLAYIKKYKGHATKEMKAYGIPASITLAQGLLESNVGESKLATRNNNHFGIKCFSKRCKKGHCSNFTDDSHKDFFRVYKSVHDSYRAHSLLLKNNSRYRRLFKLKKTDYKGWSHGLKKAGYATDPAYAQKIIRLIEDLKLYQYDK